MDYTTDVINWQDLNEIDQSINGWKMKKFAKAPTSGIFLKYRFFCLVREAAYAVKF